MSKKGKVCGEKERGVSGNGRGPSSPLTSGEGGTGIGGPLPLTPMSLLEMDEENKVLSRVAGSAHIGGGLEKGKRGQASEA